MRFDKTLLLGRQQFFGMSPERITSAFQNAGTTLAPGAPEACLRSRGGYAEGVFEMLGAHGVRSLDASTYEGATDIHDLNEPLGDRDDLRASFSAVVDGGTLEHVFNFPVALRTAMELVAANGHLLVMTPTNDQDGHGFFQFSPEVFFRAVGPENGFTIEHCFVKEDHGNWFAVKDPAIVGRRVEFRTRHSSTLFVAARRVEVRPIFSSWPQQSDYAQAWIGNPGHATRASRAARLRQRANWLYRPAVRLRARYFYPPHISARRDQFTKTEVNGGTSRWAR